MENENAESVMKRMEEVAKKNLPMSPQYYMDCSLKLISLMGNETDLLHSLQSTVAKERVIYLEEGKSVAESKLRVEASQMYEEMLKQKAKCERIVEIIRIAKIQSRLKGEEMYSGNL